MRKRKRFLYIATSAISFSLLASNSIYALSNQMFVNVISETKIVASEAVENTNTSPTKTTVSSNSKIKLTLNDVIQLSKKGNDLTWGDFSNYSGTEVGSGIYINKYDLEDGYTLLVGGLPPTSPYYINLFHNDDTSNSIDIRTNDVEAFLKSVSQVTTTNTESTTTTTPILYGDANMDNKIDNVDLVTLCQALIKEIVLDSVQTLRSDLNNDGNIDISDAAILKQYILGDKVTLGSKK